MKIKPLELWYRHSNDKLKLWKPASRHRSIYACKKQARYIQNEFETRIDFQIRHQVNGQDWIWFETAGSTAKQLRWRRNR